MTKSKIFLYFCLSFIFGVFFASLVKLPLIILGGIFVFGIILIGVFWSKNKKATIIGFCLLIFVFGALRFIQKEKTDDLGQFNGKGRLMLEGIVVDPPEHQKTYQRLKLEIKEINIAGRETKASGLVLATTGLYPEFSYGDLLEITGQLEEPVNFNSPTGEFDYKSYLAKSDIYSVIYYPEIKLIEKNQGNKIKQSLFWIKQKFEQSLEKILPEPQASFLAGLTLGERRQIPPELSLAFQKTGTTHIVALSGYNITLVASFFMTIFGALMLKRNLRFYLAVLAIIFFTVLTGASASIVRAAIMGILILIARHAGRLYSARNALIFAGAVMIFLNPKILRFDIGFQLSFMATAGLIWLAPIFDKWFLSVPKFLGLKEILIATLSAQLFVLPLILIYFGQLSIISPLANLAVLIFIPLTMLFGFLAGSLGMIWLLGAKIIAWLVWLFLTTEIKIIKFFSSLPLASISMHWGWPAAVIYYLIIAGALFLFYQKEKSQILADVFAENKN